MARTKNPGVYKITNVVNGKFYIGSTTINLYQRWNDHKSQLKTGIHPNIHLTRSVAKHGLESLQFEILEQCTNVLEREQFYIDTLHPTYNICKIAGNSAGCKRSAETCAKIGLSKKGKNFTGNRPRCNDEREKISQSVKLAYANGFTGTKGIVWSQESRKRLSKSRQGLKVNRTFKYSNFEQLDYFSREVIGIFDTAKQAAESIGRFDRPSSSKIVRACRDNIGAYGYRWRSLSVQLKSGELLEKPEAVNQQPS